MPVLLIYSEDDTMVPAEMFDMPAVRENRYIERLSTKHGGHLGFLGRRPYRFWLDSAIMEWILRRSTERQGEKP